MKNPSIAKAAQQLRPLSMHTARHAVEAIGTASEMSANVVVAMLPGTDKETALQVDMF